MSEKNKDAAIKLFGMTIPLQPPAPASSCGGKFDEKESERPKSNDQEHESRNSSSSTSEINKPTPADEDSASTKNSNSTTEQQEATNSDDQLDTKAMKKPDKILPCPRCKSLDTKFCYFNNYNVNQPRHFCKNCQRYWTAGGTMRNVPVGAGRRKSKSSSLFRRITVDVVHSNSGLIKPNHASVLCFEKPPPGPSAADAPSPCFPIPFLYPAAYLSCGAPPGSWSLPWLPPAPGKRSREDYERALMRIDDPEEAASSSVWAMVAGAKGGAFQPKGDRVKNHRAVLEAPLLLHSNPAALARSLNFQETI